MDKISMTTKTGIRGIWLTFSNGYKISIQFGAGTYSDNYDCDCFDFDTMQPNDKIPLESTTVEIGITNPQGELIQVDENHDIVIAYEPVENIAKWIAYTQNLPKE